MRYVLFSLLPEKINLIQSENLDDSEIDVLTNKALPYGSNWERFVGARSMKLFAYNDLETCFSYTVIVKSKESGVRDELYCLAILQNTSELHFLIRNYSDWFYKTASNTVEEIRSKKIKTLIKSTLTTKQPSGTLRLGFWTWLKAQFHRSLIREFHFYGADLWVEQEEFARKLYLATDWQTRVLRIPSPSLTTLSLSKGENTTIKLLAIPVTPTS